jgi:cysteine desulfurase
MHTIYLDHATTTPIAASVREAMLPFLQNMYGHPSSSHWMGRVAAEAIEDARSCISSLLETHPSEIIFTSGGTESINLGLLGAARSISREYADPHCIISNLEHAAVRLTVSQLEREGWKISIARCNQAGVVTAESVRNQIQPNTKLISITHASYEIGTIQPIAQIAQLCHDRDIILHTDATQTVGKIDFSTADLGVDLLSFSGHKFYGPKGVGGLFVQLGVPLDPIFFGDGAEAGLRPGTPPVALIAGIGQAAKLAQAGLNASVERVSELRDQFYQQLQNLIGNKLVVHGESSARLPGILSLQLPGIIAEELQQRLPEICFGPTVPRTLKSDPTGSDWWTCLGLTPAQLASTLRISIGWSTSADELSEAALMIATAYEALQVS